MSTIPPNWLGSIIQSHGAQSRAGEARAAEDAAAAERARDGSAEKRTNVIENDDTDSSVYSDAEGAGSQGRSGGEEHLEDAPDHDLDEQQEQGGLDVQA